MLNDPQKWLWICIFPPQSVFVLCNDSKNERNKCIIIHFVLPYKYVSSFCCCFRRIHFVTFLWTFLWANTFYDASYITYCSLIIFMGMHKSNGLFFHDEREWRRTAEADLFYCSTYEMRSHHVCLCAVMLHRHNKNMLINIRNHI